MRVGERQENEYPDYLKFSDNRVKRLEHFLPRLLFPSPSPPSLIISIPGVQQYGCDKTDGVAGTVAAVD